MSAEYRRGRNKHGDPVLTITVTGAHDIFRLNWNLLHAQCEFSEAAQKTYVWLLAEVARDGLERATRIEAEHTAEICTCGSRNEPVTTPSIPEDASRAISLARAVTLHAPWCGAVVNECDCQEAAPSDRTVAV